MKLLGDSCESVTAPAVSKRESDCDHLRPTPQWDAIEIANQLREEIVWVQLLDEQLQQRTRAVKSRSARRKEPHCARPKLFPPSLRIELLLGPRGIFELPVDFAERLTAFAHGCTSRNSTHDLVCADACGGPEPTRAQLWEKGRAGTCPHGEVNLVSRPR
jgi:hypothetical protein